MHDATESSVTATTILEDTYRAIEGIGADILLVGSYLSALTSLQAALVEVKRASDDMAPLHQALNRTENPLATPLGINDCELSYVLNHKEKANRLFLIEVARRLAQAQKDIDFGIAEFLKTRDGNWVE